MTEKLFHSPQPGVLLVIGTFAAVPYVHLHLEARQRFYPDVPCIVHDDCSPVSDALQDLCVAYNANFFSARERHRQQSGDLSAILLAVQSAQALKLELAVKMSRRFIPLMDWRPQIQHTAYHTQYATYSNRDDAHGFGFRSECVAFHAPSWDREPYVGQIEEAIVGGMAHFGIVEAFIHKLARDIQAADACAVNQEYERLYPRNPASNAYGIWQWLGTSRTDRQASFLWHNADNALDYYRLALAFGMTYRYEDFLDPNMGFGSGDA